MRALIVVLLRLCLLGALAVTGAHASEDGGDSAASNQFLAITPAIITNFGGPGPIHFLKVEITLRLSKDSDANKLVLHHMPHIRDVLIMLFSRQTEATLESMQGKEKLRQEALAAVQKVLEYEEGKKLVDDLLFTNFVVQN